MNLTETLKAKWTPKLDKQVGAAVKPHFLRALEAVGRLDAKRAEVGKDPNLSPAGRVAKLRDVAKEDAAPVGKAKRILAAGRDTVRKQQMALTPTVKDRTDVASAMLRGEIRSHLRAMQSRGESAQFLFEPGAESIMLEAVFEAPVELSGLTVALRDQLLQAVVDRQSGQQVADIRDQTEALDLLDVAINSATTGLQETTELKDKDFADWFAHATPIDPVEAAAEAAKVAETSVEAAALALPPGARHNLISSLLAANSDALVGQPIAT